MFSSSEKKRPAHFEILVSDYIDLLETQGSDIHIQDFAEGESKTVRIPEHEPLSKDGGIPEPISEALFSMGSFAAELAKSEDCWKYHELVNLFYHNLLTHFVYVYLDSKKSPLEQLIHLQKMLMQDNLKQVVQYLLSNHHNTLQIIKQCNEAPEKNPVVVTNAANGKFFCGIGSCGKGSAEETLARKSNLFLRMLLEDTEGTYQKNILKELFTTFYNMLRMKSFPITDKSSANQLAARMMRVILKPGFEGFCLYYRAHERHNRVHITENLLLSSLCHLPSLESLKNPQKQDKIAFLNSCKTNIHVLSIAAKDKRRIGSNPSDHFCRKDANFKQIMDDILRITYEIYDKKKRPVILDLLPLGGGAFGNDMTEFGNAVLHVLKERNARRHTAISQTQISHIYLTTFADNYQKLIESIQPVQDIHFIEYELEKHELLQPAMQFVNRGKTFKTRENIFLYVKIQNIKAYSQFHLANFRMDVPNETDSEGKALVISINANREKLPMFYQFSTTSALDMLCCEIENRGGKKTVEDLSRRFSSRSDTSSLFEMVKENALFYDRNVYLQPICDPGSKSALKTLESVYEKMLKELDKQEIVSVDLTLFGAGSMGYSMEVSCEALCNVYHRIHLKNIRHIAVITPDTELFNSIVNCVEKQCTLHEQTYAWAKKTPQLPAEIWKKIFEFSSGNTRRSLAFTSTMFFKNFQIQSVEGLYTLASFYDTLQITVYPKDNLEKEYDELYNLMNLRNYDYARASKLTGIDYLAVFRNISNAFMNTCYQTDIRFNHGEVLPCISITRKDKKTLEASDEAAIKNILVPLNLHPMETVEREADLGSDFVLL